MLELPFAQLQLAQRVWKAARGKPMVALLMNGRALAIPWVADSIPAILDAWSLGTEHGNAVARCALRRVQARRKASRDLPARDGAGAGVSRAHE